MKIPISARAFLSLSVLFSTSMSTANVPGLASLDRVIPNIEAIFEQEKIGNEYSPEGFTALKDFFRQEIEKYRKNAKSDDKKLKKTAKDVLPFYEHGLKILESADVSRDEQNVSYLLAKAVLSSTLTVDLADTAKRFPKAFRPTAGAIGGFETLLVNVILGRIPTEQVPPEVQALLQQLPPEMNQVLPVIKDLLEKDPATGQKLLQRAKRVFFSKKNVEIKLPTKPEEIAELKQPLGEIGDAHPVWYNQKALKAIGATAKARWQHLEKLITDKVSEELGVKYDIHSARKVLFFDEIKDSATSPKIDAVDGYDQKWKIKWGDEVQPEVISNRLYVALGGKINDLTYASKADELILLLKKKNKEEECSPVSASELAECLLNSRYKYNLQPNILAPEQGRIATVDKAFFDRELAKLRPANVSAKEWEKKCIGRGYVKFREAVLEFGAKQALEKGGAPGYSSDLAKNDPIARSLVLFNMWIGNRDAKDDNNKAYLMSLAPRAKKPGLLAIGGNVYLESQHDLGHSLGQIFAAGEIASMKGRDFILNNITSEEKCLSREAVICFKEPMLFVPEAWNRASVKDLVFMAKSIVELMKPYLQGYDRWQENERRDDDLFWITGQTNWPRFMQLAVIAKLTERTLGMIDALKMYVPEFANGEWRSFEIDYAADEENLRQLAAETGLKLSELKSESDGKNLLTNGKLERCETPAEHRLIDFLQKQRFPSGLSKRISRLNNDQATVGCDSVRGGLKELLSSIRPSNR